MEIGEIYILCVRVIYMLVIPACVCVLHYKKPLIFKGLWRKIIFAAIYSCISYITLLFALCIPYWLGKYAFRGPEIAFALFFGWLYLWIASIPVWFVYWLARKLK